MKRQGGRSGATGGEGDGHSFDGHSFDLHGEKFLDPEHWASLRPFGIGERKPNNYRSLLDALVENRDNLAYAWRILNDGTCDGCALGTKGMRDWTLPQVHLCNVRLRLLRLNTAPAMPGSLLEDVSKLDERPAGTFHELGRLPTPMVRHRGEAGFRACTWEEALAIAGAGIAGTVPERTAFYMTSRGQPNENYYAAQKAVRALGTNNIDSAARLCHSPSTLALKGALGVAATTCSYSDLIGTDLVVFVGSNVAQNQPVMMKYLYHARKAGTQVAVVNTFREPAMERYWVPSNAESALFGTRITDRFFEVSVGGDIAFFDGVLRHVIEKDLYDRDFVEGHTEGFDQARRVVEGTPWDELEAASGTTRTEMAALAEMIGRSRTAVFVWSMGVTQTSFGEDAVRAVLNLALARGFVGRPKCGVMPVRGHSGVQGGAEMGAYATAFPGGLAVTDANAAHLSELWGFAVPSRPGMTAPEMIDAAHEGTLDVLVSSGGNFLNVLPDPAYCREALEKVPLRVHLDIVPSAQMLVEPAQTVVLLPVQTRYEMQGGVTETSTERRVIFSPEIPGPRIPGARPEWEVWCQLAGAARPETAAYLGFAGTAAIREEIARVVPQYAGISSLRSKGDNFQYGGPHLCAGWEFPTPSSKANFLAVAPPRRELPPGALLVSARRGKQFNSMVQGARDAHTGAGRDAVIVNPHDAQRLGLAEGDPVSLLNDDGALHGHVLLGPVSKGTVQVHWPEGNVLLGHARRSPASGIPDYTAWAFLEPAARVVA